MLWLWRYLSGFLEIEISGDYIESFLNEASAKKINIWNLFYKNGKIYANIKPKNFIKLLSFRKKYKCKIKIISKNGIYFKILKHKKRFGFSAGVIIYFLTLYILSCSVWIINIEGNKTISDIKILNSCRKIGIFEGVLKSKINNKYDSHRLQLTQDGIAWCSLNIEGSVLTVNISETDNVDKITIETPSNLKAKIDGKIKKISVTSGDTVVRVGETVSKGQILVSGIQTYSSSNLFSHSSGDIVAETIRMFSAKGNYKQEIKHKSGDEIKRYTISFFNFKVPLYLGNIKKPYDYKKEINTIELFNNKIPIKIACETYQPLVNKTVEYEKEKLIEILYDDIKNQVEKFDLISANEEQKQIIYTDNGILLNVTFFCEENIAMQDTIILSDVN